MIKGMNSGLAVRGMWSGMGNGNSVANIESGYRGGLHNNLPNKDKMLDPVNLQGRKKPLLYGLADYYNITGGNVTNLNDIANTGNYWTSNASIANRPIPYENRLGGRTMLVYDGSSSVMRQFSNVSSTPREAYTIMAVIKMNGNPSAVVFDNNSITGGGFLLSNPSNSASALQMRSRFYCLTSQGATYISDVGPTTSSSIANTPAEFHDYMIVTSKIRIRQTTEGDGSEQDLYINGRRHHILSGTDNFINTSLTEWSMLYMGIGNNPGSQNSLAQDFEMGMGLILPYWLDNAEQEKIENYFRWYYKKSF